MGWEEHLPQEVALGSTGTGGSGIGLHDTAGRTTSREGGLLQDVTLGKAG